MPLKTHSKVLSAYISEETHAAITELADRRGVTVSRLVGELATRELAREARKTRGDR